MIAKQYLASPHLAVDNNDEQGIINSKTNVRHQVSADTLAILELFSTKPLSIKAAMAQIDCEKDDIGAIEAFINHLIEQQLLIEPQQNETLQQSSADSDQAIFTPPACGFFNAPIFAKDHPQLANVDIGFIGVPFDLGTTGYPGARFAPDKMRQLSAAQYGYHQDIFTHKGKGWWSVDANRQCLAGIALADMGNVILQVGEAFDSFYHRVTSACDVLLQQDIFAVLVGGDHSLSYAALKALNQHYRQPVNVIHIDAHSDRGSLIAGLANNHGNVFTRVLNENLVGQLNQFGVRCANEAPVPCDNVHLTSLATLEQQGIERAIDYLTTGNYYLSIDIDVIDPSFAPGTGTPAANGMTPAMLTELIKAISHKVNIIAMDLVEVNPMMDRNHQTSELAIALLLNSLSDIFAANNS